VVEPLDPSVLLISIHDFFNGHATSTLWEERTSQNGASNRNFFLAGNRRLNRQAKYLALGIENGTSIFPIQSTATTGNQTRSPALAAAFAIDAANADLATAAGAIATRVQTAIDTRKGTTQDNVFGVDRFSAAHDDDRVKGECRRSREGLLLALDDSLL
jgi:hypothetical protein